METGAKRYSEAKAECAEINGDVAFFKDQSEWEKFMGDFKEVVVIFFIGRIFEIVFQLNNLKSPTKLLYDQGLVIFYPLWAKKWIWSEKLVKIIDFHKFEILAKWVLLTEDHFNWKIMSFYH